MKFCGLLGRYDVRLVVPSSTSTSIFLAHILFDRLGILYHVLADKDLFLGYWPLLQHNLFLSDGDADLVLAYLGRDRRALLHTP